MGLLGDSGSASEVSEAAVTAVAAAYIGRGPETSLTGLLCERSGVTSVVAFLEAASRQRIDTTVFSPEVVLAAEEGDAVARSILVEAGRSLGATAAHVVRRLGMEETRSTSSSQGACSERRLDISSTASDRSCVRWLPRCGSNRSRIPPVVGAVLMAIDTTAEAQPPGLRTSLAEGVTAALDLLLTDPSGGRVSGARLAA